MALTVATYAARDAASSGADLGFGALALCRAYRGTKGVTDARYWMKSAGVLAVVIETERGVDLWGLAAANAEVAEAGLAMLELASNPDVQIWADPRDGADALAHARGT